MRLKMKRVKMTEQTTISKSIFLNASRRTVWAFLTDNDKLGQWFRQAQADLAEGRDYALVATTDDGVSVPQIWGRVLKMDPPNRLVMTFAIGPFDGAETTLTWVLEDAAGGTRLSMTHEGIAEAAGPAALQLLMALDHGWDKHLGELRQHVTPVV
jgi:uncharacterized protein YndB with AHSA1/START domain